ncbi:GPI ethanolamine phosphate transferase 2 [Pseudocercospora fuligena]|uniref:GPI ethanolamine phosphate transferase 2 n=1 Tax=Pseudocercospora fuligena TaxID=685502 RepID=A0A8H6VBQ0_9PEZI|nr:GPI ethanolamine phosphate transferase 2 [Pseudocercospora fuligena]
MTLTHGSRTACLALANILLPIAVLVFASGFFPYKPVLPGLATFEEHGEQGLISHGSDTKFDKVVFMVVDALRSDFVFGGGSGMDFTQSLIRDDAAIPFTAHATPPTVTMPRVKALTTGSVPSFLDLILNFAESDTSSSLAAQDTWLSQIKARGGKIVFLGDDTWLKLFPASATGVPFFERADGTSSFFVSDFTEVDNNVTRHVPEELARSDWDALIMHYLGLDHIGHKTGPMGPNMLPKQKEMDGIVKMIYTAMEEELHHRNTLLVLAGDHGMNNGGNHGGSGPGETEPALVFVSPKFKSIDRKKRRQYWAPTHPKDGTEFEYFTKVEQSDLVPTLAGLMGLPISRNSLGVSIPEMNVLWSMDETIAHLKRNAIQIAQIVKATYGEESWDRTVNKYRVVIARSSEGCDAISSDQERLACLWATFEMRTKNVDGPYQESQARTSVLDFLLEAQDVLSGTASSYNIPRMIIGMVITAGILGLTLFSFETLWPVSIPGIFFALISILYGVMMFASSYVEEEQQFWYWTTPAWIITLAFLRLPKASASPERIRLGLAVFTLLAIHRLSVRWNQTGQKHAGAPDIVHTFFTEHHVLMWMLILATYVYNGWSLATRALAGLVAPEIAAVFSAALVLPAVVFKLTFTQADAPELVQDLALGIRNFVQSLDLVLQARIVFSGLAVTTILVSALSVMSARQSQKGAVKWVGVLPSLAERLHVLLSLFLMTQTRAPNVPLFLGLELQREALAFIFAATTTTQQSTTNPRLSTTTVQTPPITSIATTTLLLSHTTYFAFGGSNSISSIDLSNAYNGVADYNILAVGILLFASNWAGAIWWVSAANLLINSNKPSLFFARPKVQTQGGRSWIDAERKKLHEDALAATMGPSKATSSNTATSSTWSSYIAHITAFEAAALLAVMAACTALRTHLFIWTVFSPKYLYAMAWSVGWHIIVNIGLGTGLSAMSGIA